MVFPLCCSQQSVWHAVLLHGSHQVTQVLCLGRASDGTNNPCTVHDCVINNDAVAPLAAIALLPKLSAKKVQAMYKVGQSYVCDQFPNGFGTAVCALQLFAHCSCCVAGRCVPNPASPA